MSVSAEEYQSKKAQTEKLRNEQYQLNEKIARLEGEVNILTAKSGAFEQELGKMVAQNKSLITLLQKQQQQKLALLARDRQISYNYNRGQVEARRNQTLVKNLTQQVEKLRAQIATNTLQKIQWVKQKQELSNKLLVLQQKYKATKNLQQIILLLKNSLSTTTKQNDLLKAENQELKKKLNSSTPVEKTVIKNNSEMIDGLITDFQLKLNAKQQAIAEQREKYQLKISQLNLTIAQLEANNQKYL